MGGSRNDRPGPPRRIRVRPRRDQRAARNLEEETRTTGKDDRLPLPERRRIARKDKRERLDIMGKTKHMGIVGNLGSSKSTPSQNPHPSPSASDALLPHLFPPTPIRQHEYRYSENTSIYRLKRSTLRRAEHPKSDLRQDANSYTSYQIGSSCHPVSS